MIPLRDIRRQIASVRKISHITRAMKTVSAIRLMKVQGQVVRQRPYALKLREVIADLVARTPGQAHPLLLPSGAGVVPDRAEERPAPAQKPIVCLVLGSDRGLCGAFNNNLVLEVQRFIHARPESRLEILVAGKKLRDLLHSRKVSFDRFLTDLYQTISYEKVVKLGGEFLGRYRNGEITEVWCVYTEFQSSARQQVTAERLLPIRGENVSGETLFPEYRYEPDEFTVLDSVLPMYYNREWWRIFLESEASEHIMRMRAMDMATVNAAEMIMDLTTVLNKARQELITRELSEISSAAEALRGE